MKKSKKTRIKIFSFADGAEWWAATSAKRALKAANDFCGDLFEDDELPTQLTEKEMDEFIYYDDLANETGKRTFREQLEKMIAEGADFSAKPFACSDY